MSNIVRAWKDEAYRQSLSAEEHVLLPANLAGEIELTDAELAAIFGAQASDDNGDNSTLSNISGSYNAETGILNRNNIDLSNLNVNVLGINLQRHGLTRLLAASSTAPVPSGTPASSSGSAP